jgi:hypothetical protein
MKVRAFEEVGVPIPSWSIAPFSFDEVRHMLSMSESGCLA